MRLHRIAAIGQLRVDRQIFAEIRHTARDADIEHLASNHAIREPVRRGFTDEIDMPACEPTEVDIVSVLAAPFADQEPERIRFAIQRSVGGEIRVYIDEKANTVFGQSFDPLLQVREARVAGLPVPKEATAEVGLADARPILAPQARDDGPRLNYPVQPFEAAFTVLEADDCPLHRPIRQGRRSPEVLRQARDQSGQIVCSEKLDPAGRIVAAQDMPVCVCEVGVDIGTGVDMQRQQARREEGRLRIIGRPVIACAQRRVGHMAGQLAMRIAPDARFADPERK